MNLLKSQVRKSLLAVRGLHRVSLNVVVAAQAADTVVAVAAVDAQADHAVKVPALVDATKAQ
jgi:hypothetical protein